MAQTARRAPPPTRSGADECAEALDAFIAAIRPVPVLAHEEAISRFRALARADARFRSALLALPATARHLLQHWKERTDRGLVTGVLLDWDSGSPAVRSKRADELFAVLEDLTRSHAESQPFAAAGLRTQIRDLLEQSPLERAYLHLAHDELLASSQAGDEDLSPGDVGELERATAARHEWESQRAEIVRHNLKLVVNVAKRYRRAEVSLLELIQEGTTGLVRAVEKFDAERGFRFSTYAVWWIEQAVIRGIQKSARAIRLPTYVHERQLQLRHAERSLRSRTAGEPSADLIAESIDLTLDDTDLLLASLAPIRSLQAPLRDEDDSTLQDTLAAEAPEHLDDAVCWAEVRSVLDRGVEALTSRERQVLRWRFGFAGGGPESLEQIGKRLGLSRERIRQIERDILAKLREQPRIQALAEALTETR